mmetsp:Transcript_99749/g.250080  ORF Transcript_99749/g.250080 Transcript_99749/m.250080 type:complete len:205 (+) Transcript_99749:1465-2079(+)
MPMPSGPEDGVSIHVCFRVASATAAPDNAQNDKGAHQDSQCHGDHLKHAILVHPEDTLVCPILARLEDEIVMALNARRGRVTVPATVDPTRHATFHLLVREGPVRVSFPTLVCLRTREEAREGVVRCYEGATRRALHGFVRDGAIRAQQPPASVDFSPEISVLVVRIACAATLAILLGLHVDVWPARLRRRWGKCRHPGQQKQK